MRPRDSKRVVRNCRGAIISTPSPQRHVLTDVSFYMRSRVRACSLGIFLYKIKDNPTRFLKSSTPHDLPRLVPDSTAEKWRVLPVLHTRYSVLFQAEQQ